MRQLLDNSLSQNTAATVRVRFQTVAEQPVCVVSVAASGKPVFAKPVKGSAGSAEEFWVRTGNSTRQLHSEDLLEYQPRTGSKCTRSAPERRPAGVGTGFDLRLLSSPGSGFCEFAGAVR